MTRADKAPRSKRAAWINAWFVADAIVALAPPIYWAADGKTTPILGLPAAVFYFVAVAVFIAASIVAAYAVDARNGGTG